MKFPLLISKAQLLALAFALLPHSLLAQISLADGDYAWQLKRDKDNIQIFTSLVPDSSYKAVKAVTRVKSNIGAAVALVMDVKACSLLSEYCRESYIVRQETPLAAYVYTFNDMPFPVKNRDVVALVEWRVSQDKHQATMRSSVAGNDLVAKANAIRLQYALAEWRFTQIDADTLEVESYAHIDPNGAVPAWIINMLLVDSPYKTLTNMRELIETGPYSGRSAEILEQ